MWGCGEAAAFCRAASGSRAPKDTMLSCRHLVSWSVQELMSFFFWVHIRVRQLYLLRTCGALHFNAGVLSFSCNMCGNKQRNAPDSSKAGWTWRLSRQTGRECWFWNCAALGFSFYLFFVELRIGWSLFHCLTFWQMSFLIAKGG